MVNVKVGSSNLWSQGERETENVHAFSGSFMELLVEEDHSRKVECEKIEDAGFVFFPDNHLPSASSSSSTAQMLCFGGEDDLDNGAGLPFPQLYKNSYLGRRGTAMKAMPLIGRGGGRRGRQSEVSSCSKRKKVKAKASPVSRRMVKEKLGSHVRALQQLVSPMGKSDTATVLQETFGYIKFLHDQVQVLSSAYLERGGERDLRKRGLCLVPVSSTVIIEGSNGADISSPAIAWSPASSRQ